MKYPEVLESGLDERKGKSNLIVHVCFQLWLSQGRPYLGPRVGKGVNHPLPSKCKVGVLRGKPELILVLNIVMVFCVYLDVRNGRALFVDAAWSRMWALM